MKRDPESRFFNLVRQTDSCWLWLGHCSTKKGGRKYGHFWNGEKYESAHRFSYRHFNGFLPDNLMVCHSCDVTICVNPRHLFLGTGVDNMQDAICKGRIAKGIRHGRITKPHKTARGSRHGCARLTEELVLLIRQRVRDGARQNEMARELKVTPQTINLIVNRKIWSHV